MSGEENPIVFPENHVHLQIIAGKGESPIVTHVHPDEGRDVKFFFESVLRLGGIVRIRVSPTEGFGVALAPRGVGDLDQEGIGLGLLGVPNVIKSHGIEAVTESPEVSEYRNRALDRGAGLFGNGFPDRVLEAGFLGRVIIFSLKRGKIRAVDRPKPAVFEDLVYFVEKKVRHVKFVPQVVLFGRAAMMSDFSEIKRTSHPNDAPKALHTRSPLLSPSS